MSKPKDGNKEKMNVFKAINNYMEESLGLFWYVIVNIISGFIVSLLFVLVTYLINLITQNLGFVEEKMDYAFTLISTISSAILIFSFMAHGVVIFFIKSYKGIRDVLHETKVNKYFKGNADILPGSLGDVINDKIKEISKADKIEPIDDREGNENDDNKGDIDKGGYDDEN